MVFIRMVDMSNEMTEKEAKDAVLGQDFKDMSEKDFVKKHGRIRYDHYRYMFNAEADERYNNYM